MNVRLLLFIFLFPLFLLAQRSLHGSSGLILPRDKVRLRNGDAETGRIIYSDSNKIMLRKYDYSEKKILRSDIDTIEGLSWFTYFIAPGIGPAHWNAMVSQRLDTFSADGTMLSVKLGTMRKKRWAFYLDLNMQGGNSLGLLHAGAGVRYYFPLDYVRKSSTYIGFNYGYNVPTTNVNRFFSTGLNLGYEYRWKDKHRFFLEYYHMRTNKFDPPSTGYAFLFGMRFSMEYSDRYYRLNNNLPLTGGNVHKQNEEKKIRTEF
jgi:hypothetical protein